MKKATPSIIRLTVAILLASAATTTAADVRYNITDLGTAIRAMAVNSFGQASGYVADESGIYPAVWQNGKAVRLQPTTQTGYAYDLNGGLVVGTSKSQAACWDLTGSVTYLAAVKGNRGSCANAISSSGMIAGYYHDSEMIMHACYWSSRDANVVTLAVPNNMQSTAWAINNRGDVLIGAGANPGDHVYVYTQGSYVPVGTDVPDEVDWAPRDINDDGVITGFMEMSYGKSLGFIWKNGVTTILPTPAGRSHPSPLAINTEGVVVGDAWQIGLPDLACIWDAQGVRYLRDLVPVNSGWSFEEAWDINDSGQIVGYGTYNGMFPSFLLTPVPEPSTIISFLTGLAGLYGFAIRRHR